MTDLDLEKRRAAEAAIALVRDGMRLGLGSGSTVFHAIRVLGERVRAGLQVSIVTASEASAQLARSLGIPVRTLEECPRLELAIDGADEVDGALRMIKGGGGALLREKVVASAAEQLLIIADSSKQVERLGRFPLPVEVLPFALPVVLERLRQLGCEPRPRRLADGTPYLTDQHNHIVDCAFGRIEAPEALALTLDGIPGVLEHGLFLTEASRLFVGRGGRVEELRRPSASSPGTPP